MKQNSQSFLIPLLFALLLLSQSVSSRFLSTKQGEKPQILKNEIARVDSRTEFFQDLILGETKQCEDNEEEECVKRRMLEEEHLDYVYTQDQTP